MRFYYAVEWVCEFGAMGERIGTYYRFSGRFRRDAWVSADPGNRSPIPAGDPELRRLKRRGMKFDNDGRQI